MKNKLLKSVLCIALFCAVILPISVSARSSVQGGSYGSASWIFYDDGYLYIYGTGAMGDYDGGARPGWMLYKNQIKTVEISEGITHIGRAAFEQCPNITSVQLPSTITSIGEWGFYGCESLTSLTLPSAVKTIGQCAFAECNALESINIPSGINTIEYGTFHGARSLKSITIPDSVTSVGYSAFEYNNSLTYLEIGDGVKEFTANRFGEFPVLKTLKIGSGVTNIDASMFYKNTELVSITVDSNNKYYKSNTDRLFNKAGTKLIRYCPKSSGTRFEAYGFTEVEPYAFYGSSKLKQIILPETVNKIGECAFMNCKSVEGIIVLADNKTYSSADGCIFDEDKTVLVAYPAGNTATVYTLPSTVKTIEKYAVYDCDNLKELVLPNGLKTIGEYAFYGSDVLEKITIPSSVESVGEYAFAYCIALSDLTLCDGIKSIDREAFYNCDSLERVVIPGSITTISDYLFENCDKLAEVYIEDGVTTIGYRAFYNWGSVKSALKIIALPSSITSVDYAFNDCYSITDVYYNGTQAQWDQSPLNESYELNRNSVTRHYVSYVTVYDNENNVMAKTMVENGKLYSEENVPQTEGYETILYTDAGRKAIFDFTKAVNGNTALYAYLVSPTLETRYTKNANGYAFDITVDNKGIEAFEKATVFAALFDKDGRCVGAGHTDVSSIGEIKSVTVNTNNTAASAQIMLWDGMRVLSDDYRLYID